MTMTRKNQEYTGKRDSQSRNHQHYQSDDFDTRRVSKQRQRHLQEKRQSHNVFDWEDDE